MQTPNRLSLSELFTVETRRDPKDGPELMGSATKLVPDPDLVANLVRAIMTSEHAPSDRRRDVEQLSIDTREGVMQRAPHIFWLPERLLRRTTELNTRRFLYVLADEVIGEAQRRISKESIGKAAKGQLAITDPRWAYSVGRDTKHLYFDIKTRARPSIREAALDFQGFTDAMKALYRAAIIEVLSDGKFLETIRGNLEFSEHIDALVVFRDEIERLRAQAEDVETPEQKEAFLLYLKQCVTILGCPDLQVEVLDAKDALLEACKGLYRAKGTNNKPTIYVALSIHGTDQLREMDDLNQIIAHEVAHYQLDENPRVPTARALPKEPNDDPKRVAMKMRMNRRIVDAAVYDWDRLDASHRDLTIRDIGAAPNEWEIARKQIRDPNPSISKLGKLELATCITRLLEAPELNIVHSDAVENFHFVAPNTIEINTNTNIFAFLKALSDEITHYLINIKKVPLEDEDLDTRAHNFTHTTLTAENLRRLRECRAQLSSEGTVTLMTPYTMDTSTPVLTQMSTLPCESPMENGEVWHWFDLKTGEAADAELTVDPVKLNSWAESNCKWKVTQPEGRTLVLVRTN